MPQTIRQQSVCVASEAKTISKLMEVVHPNIGAIYFTIKQANT